MEEKSPWHALDLGVMKSQNNGNLGLKVGCRNKYSYLVAGSSKEAANTRVPSWRGRRNFSSSETSVAERENIHFMTRKKPRPNQSNTITLKVNLPPAHISNAFIFKTSPLTPEKWNCHQQCIYNMQKYSSIKEWEIYHLLRQHWALCQHCF